MNGITEVPARAKPFLNLACVRRFVQDGGKTYKEQGGDLPCPTHSIVRKVRREVERKEQEVVVRR